MAEQGIHPAVCAGLMGGAAWPVSNVAFKVSVLDDFAEIFSQSLLLKLVAGGICGMAIAGIVVATVNHRAGKKAEQEFVFPQSSGWSQESASSGVYDDLSAQDTGRLPKAARSSQRHAHSAAHVQTHKYVRETTAPRHFATSSPMPSARQEPRVVQKATPARGKHFASAAPSFAHEITTQKVTSAPQVAVGPAPQAVERLTSSPMLKMTGSWQTSSVTKASSPSVTGRLRIRERMAAKTKGVRAVLAERLDANALDGVPIITKADGTVNDIAPSWFDQTLAPAIGKRLSGITGKLDDTAERVPVSQDPDGLEATSRAAYIASHVAEVNEGMFPERRRVEDLENGDVWEQALAAMGETLGESPRPFQDMVGGPSTIDDPEGLEAPTGFIPFRVPAAHPEVIDTDTYVDYLLREELSQNGSQTLRNSTHAHLRVIEGGTAPLRLRKRTEEPAPKRRGRHFAKAPLAAEA
ncbi:MAG: hypothetical protein Q4C09_00535 [Atopobiaceae bacterium]|nr:hypothetical protein [Atopobiaceae bacterium]